MAIMTTLERMEQISRRPWFIALFRWTTLGLVPASFLFGGWLINTVYNSQIALASLTTEVSAVTRRVDAIDDSLDAIERERQVRRDKLAEQTAQVSSRLSALEASQALMVKQLDRLIDLIDTKPNPNSRSLNRSRQ